MSGAKLADKDGRQTIIATSTAPSVRHVLGLWIWSVARGTDRRWGICLRQADAHEAAANASKAMRRSEIEWLR